MSKSPQFFAYKTQTMASDTRITLLANEIKKSAAKNEKINRTFICCFEMSIFPFLVNKLIDLFWHCCGDIVITLPTCEQIYDDEEKQMLHCILVSVGRDILHLPEEQWLNVDVRFACFYFNCFNFV
jgi:hypothetical protein